MKKVKVGVIGLGRMGKHHCRIYSNLRYVDFVGVYDLDHDSVCQVSELYDVPRYNNVDDLLEQVDAVSITTLTPAHYELAMRTLAAGVHALVEKPLTETIEQAEEVTRTAEESGLVVQVGHIERFNPTYCELLNVLDDMSIFAINFRRLSPFKGSNTDVDVVLDLMTHDIDLLLDITPLRPSQITASGFNVFSDHFDHVSVQMDYEGELLATLTASRVTEQKIRSIEITAHGAYIEADLFSKGIFVHRHSLGEYQYPRQGNVKYHQESFVEKILVPAVEPLFKEIEHFINCVREGKTPAVTARDGLEALRLACKIREIAAENQTIASRPLATG